jgi:hypothetical protein
VMGEEDRGQKSENRKKQRAAGAFAPAAFVCAHCSYRFDVI